MKPNKALLIVEPTDKAMDRAFSEISKLTNKYKGMTLISFPDYETLGKAITGARLELLNAIRKKKPNSIQELARIVGRDFKNIYTDVKFLYEYGLIDLKEKGPRKASKPIAKFSELVLAA
jgi:predicted transcriptional regulator